MIISSQKQLIFIHIPKNAGTSITHLLKPYSDNINEKIFCKHSALNDIYNYLTFEQKKYYKIAVVRNPFDWAVSLYHYTKKQPSDPRHKIAKKLSFKEYIKWWFNEPKSKWPALYGQLYYATLNDIISVDQIIRFEKLNEGINQIKTQFNIKENLKKLNVTKHKSYKELYDEKTKKLVYDYWEEDFECLGYKF